MSQIKKMISAFYLNFNGLAFNKKSNHISLTGAQGLQYRGAVYVYHDSAHGLSVVPDITLTMPRNASQPPQHAHTNYGYSLTSCQSSYELIGSPFYDNQKGLVYMPEVGEGLHYGQQNFSWFGYSHDIVHVNVPQTYVSLDLETVGSPNYRFVIFIGWSRKGMK